MPSFQFNMMFEATRTIKAFLNLEGGVTRGELPDPARQQDTAYKLEGTRKRLQNQQRKLERSEREKAHLWERLSAPERGAGVVPSPSNLVWVFGTARVGSTWLARMMSELKGYTLWREPRVGALFGSYYYMRSRERDSKDAHFIMGRNRETWLRSIREFILNAAGATFSKKECEGYLVIQEPNGSVGAPLLMEALPESRMILLIRDPRDVVASGLDAAQEGSWAADVIPNRHIIEGQPNAFVKERAEHYVKFLGNAKEAYEAHQGHKVRARYEDLRADTLGTMKHIYSELGIPVDEGELAWSVEKHSWGNVPKEKKGTGKFHRKATPGGWKEDLTPEQVEVVERITAPLLKEFYPA